MIRVSQVFSTIILIELFGSPFMRNSSLVLALLVGLIVSAIVKVILLQAGGGRQPAALPPGSCSWAHKQVDSGTAGTSCHIIHCVFE
jgi:hypothetical protein